MNEFSTYRVLPSGGEMIEVMLWVEYDWDFADLRIEGVSAGDFKYLRMNGETVKIPLTHQESADVEDYLYNLNWDEEFMDEAIDDRQAIYEDVSEIPPKEEY